MVVGVVVAVVVVLVGVVAAVVFVGGVVVVVVGVVVDLVVVGVKAKRSNTAINIFHIYYSIPSLKSFKNR